MKQKKRVNPKPVCLFMIATLLCLFVLAGCGKDETAMSEDVAAGGAVSDGKEAAEENDTAEKSAMTGASGEEGSSEEETLAGAKEEGTSEDMAAEESVKEPVKVKGIYVTGSIAGTEKMDELITLVEETELNAMVIDIKNDEGKVTYKMQSDTVLEIESGVRYIQDMDGLMEKLRGKDIYLIARIVAFKDPYLAEKKPEWSLKMEDGTVFRDKNGEAWVNPYKKEVWDYLLEIGAQAAEIGFDEVQFDYIRFTTDGNVDKIDYGEEAADKTKEEVITEFTKYAYDTLKPLGVAVSADVFGTIIDSEQDAGLIGQNYQEMASHLDYICPMVYPSHYQNGVYGIEVPDKAPYDTVYQAMKVSREKLEAKRPETKAEAGDETEMKMGTKTAAEAKGSEENDAAGHVAGVRVWLQDFTASWLREHLSYGPEEVRAQIQAVYDAGYEEWILWNAKMNYTVDALLPYWEQRPPQTENTASSVEEVQQPAETIEGAEPSAEEVQQPAETTEEAEPSAEEVQQPAETTEGAEPSAEETQQPAEGTEQPAEGAQPPAEGAESSAGNAGQPEGSGS